MSRRLSVLRTSWRLCLCIFHVLSRSLSNFCARLSGSSVVSAFLTPVSPASPSLSASASRWLGVSGISRLPSGLWPLPALCAPTLLTSPGKLAHTSGILPPPRPPLPGGFDPARVAPAGGPAPPPAAAATLKPGRGGWVPRWPRGFQVFRRVWRPSAPLLLLDRSPAAA